MHRIFILLITLCFSCSGPSPEAPSKPTLLVTIAPYAFAAEWIASDTCHVETLIPPGTNIHIFEPRPKQIENSGKATIWFQIQEPFESKVSRVFKEKNPNMQFVDLQQGLPLLSPHSSVNLGAACSHDHGDRDYHTWTSPKLFLQQARMIADTLIETFPEHRSLYEKNFNDLALRLQQLDKKIESLLKPYEGDAILISHPALSYFCKDYSLIQLSVECEGKDPRPKDLEAILRQAETYTVRVAFLQQGFNNRGAMIIGKKLKIPTHKIDPLAKDYLKNMQQIAEYIAQ